MANENQHAAQQTSVPNAAAAGQFLLGSTTPVNRMGYGAIRLSGPTIMGPATTTGPSRAARRRLEDLAAAEITLTASDLAAIEALGGRLCGRRAHDDRPSNDKSSEESSQPFL